MLNKTNFITLMLFSVAVPHIAMADGQSVPINYDSLSFIEEPLAIELGPATMGINLLFDQSVNYNVSSDDDQYNSRVVGDVSVQTQLPNSWQISANYVGGYNRLAEDEYTDNMALSISDEWGTLAGGNVTGTVFEKTRRQRGAGNAVLENDNFIGALDETGGFYAVRYNSYEASITADQEGRLEAGLSFERPIGRSNYFTSVRMRKGNLSENPSSDQDADTLGGAIVGEYLYGSYLIDGQLGYENIEINGTDGNKNDHVFGSLGAQYKTGAFIFSAEGGIGRLDGEDRRAAALGSRIDVARGASLNLGANYVFVNDDDETNAVGSVRYEF